MKLRIVVVGVCSIASIDLCTHDLLTLLFQFYELDSGAIKILLEGSDENMDLPFTPGPKEHTIIHHTSDPQRSILLMGRSGTGVKNVSCGIFVCCLGYHLTSTLLHSRAHRKDYMPRLQNVGSVRNVRGKCTPSAAVSHQE